ncbi:MAG: metal-sensitive transcriptional regulator [Deltaproteobacteria bacterium]|nr:metal-sensitive transcriptional regulator [Deltaproteobacteria bacterium]
MSGKAKHSAAHVHQPDKAALQKRLARIEGQVRGVAAMVQEDRYCIDILTQIAAVRSALSSVSIELLRNHTQGCVAHAIEGGDGRASIDELMTVVERLTR